LAKLKGTTQLGDVGLGENYIIRGFTQVFKFVNWILLTQDRVQWCVLVNKVTKLRIP